MCLRGEHQPIPDVEVQFVVPEHLDPKEGPEIELAVAVWVQLEHHQVQLGRGIRVLDPLVEVLNGAGPRFGDTFEHQPEIHQHPEGDDDRLRGLPFIPEMAEHADLLFNRDRSVVVLGQGRFAVLNQLFVLILLVLCLLASQLKRRQGCLRAVHEIHDFRAMLQEPLLMPVLQKRTGTTFNLLKISAPSFKAVLVALVDNRLCH
mmetsp:Transcript_11610/g.21015  ORF Transcript_11610/g.21015 Transcript_11610/m.21015 type:complete len:204 (-) Transcript_11610:1799-2410(-)